MVYRKWSLLVALEAEPLMFVAALQFVVASSLGIWGVGTKREGGKEDAKAERSFPVHLQIMDREPC